MKNLSLFLVIIFSLFLFTNTAEAKVLPQVAKALKVTTSKVATAGINVSPRLRSDRRALIVYFSNLQNAKNVSYMLTYETSEQQEGARGDIQTTGASSLSQELLFGTCSKGVCRYHTGIKNMKLEVSYTILSGKRYIKRYKIKV